MSSPQAGRGNPSMGDILRSVFVIGVIILALWGIGRFFTTTPDSPVRSVDYATAVDGARPTADFPILAPPALPAGWTATSARYEPSSWHLGVVTSDGEYIGLEQVKISVAQALDRFAEESKAAGETTIDGKTWRVRTEPDGDTTLVRREDGLTTLVIGSAEQAVIEDYVMSLSAG